MDLGESIRIIRKSKNIKQNELASKVNLSCNSLSQIELGLSFPKQSTIKATSEVLGVSTAYILLMCISEDDIPIEKRKMFTFLHEALKKLLLEK